MFNEPTTTPLLSICIPAYNRPKWLQRALQSILTTPLKQQSQIEIIVSDDSTVLDCQHITHEILETWQGSYTYQKNSPSLGMAANWNHCIQIAAGEYILLLHDDDYLVPQAPSKILQTLQQHPNSSALLFGVNVVSSQQRILKQQVFKSLQKLTPETALEHVLTNSSFIRFPGIILNHKVFQTVGCFDTEIGGIADIHLWIRICHKYGLLCIPITTANYTVHENALTMKMFNAQVLIKLEKLFQKVAYQNWLSQETLEKCRANYFHQFILAGTVRFLKKGNIKSANDIFNLLDKFTFQDKHIKLKWRIVKNTLKVILSPSKLLYF